MTTLSKLVIIMSDILDEILSLLAQFLWPPEREKQRAKRLRVLTAATHHYLQYGYQKASMDDIAINAGVSKGALYLYFPSKLNLLCSALALEAEQYYQNHLIMSDTSWTPRERFSWTLAKIMGQYETSPLSTKLRFQTHDLHLVITDYSRESETLAAIGTAEMRLLESLVGDLLGSRFKNAEIKVISGIVYDVIAGLILLPQSVRQTPLSGFMSVNEMIVNGLESIKPGEILAPGSGTVRDPRQRFGKKVHAL